MAEKHQVVTAHGTLQLEASLSNNQPVVLVTLAKPFFPPFSFCLSAWEALDLKLALSEALDEAADLGL